MIDATEILKKLKINKKGKYENQMYVIDLEDSNEYAKMYTLLCDNAVNTEYPAIENNTNNNTIKVINYFETEIKNQAYNIFLIADLDEDHYYVKIGEK